MASLLDRLKERKLVQWALAYAAGAWVLLEVTSFVSDRFAWPEVIVRALTLLAGVGFFVALVLAWYHGEKGRQRVSGPELLLLAGLLGVAGLLLGVLGGEGEVTQPETAQGALTEPRASRVPLSAVLYTNPAVAVLPLANMGDADNQDFVDGLHEEILGNLAKIGALTVLSRQAVLQYRDSEKTIRQIGEELDVDAVLEGSVRRAGDRLRITAQLIHAESDAHLWVETYEDELTVANIFDIQERVAREVARALQAVLTPEEEDRVAQAATYDLTAYDLFLAQKTLGSSRDERIQLLQRAVELDSMFALAWADLGIQYSLKIQDQGDPVAWADSGRAAAQRAIDLDPELGLAYMALGFSYYLGERKLQAAIEAQSRALQVQPNDGVVANNLGVMLRYAGRWPDAFELFKRSARLRSVSASTRTGALYSYLGLFDRAEAELEAVRNANPTRPTGLSVLSRHWARRGEFERAMQVIEQYIRDRPDQIPPRLWATLLALISGDLDKAREHAEDVYRLAPDGSPSGNLHSTKTTLGYVRLIEGKQEEADSLFLASLEQVESLLDRGADDPFLRVEIAAIKAAQGRTEDAVSWFQRAYDTGLRHVRLAELDPMFDSLRGNPEFERIMAQMRADVEVMREEVLAMEADLEAARLASEANPQSEPE